MQIIVFFMIRKFIDVRYMTLSSHKNKIVNLSNQVHNGSCWKGMKGMKGDEGAGEGGQKPTMRFA